MVFADLCNNAAFGQTLVTLWSEYPKRTSIFGIGAVISFLLILEHSTNLYSHEGIWLSRKTFLFRSYVCIRTGEWVEKYSKHVNPFEDNKAHELPMDIDLLKRRLIPNPTDQNLCKVT